MNCAALHRRTASPAAGPPLPGRSRATLWTLHLFAGAGGGLLADLILGHEPVCAVELDDYCCEVLRERAAEGWFPKLQVWQGDVRAFPAEEWAGRVDCVHAGFPCQPHSVAGKRKGADDERNLWPAVADILGRIRPQWAFLENVPGIVSGGFLAVVLGDLARLGYDARWTVLGADDVGASHRRKRWWCLANLPRHGRVAWGAESARQQGRSDAAECGGAVAHCRGARLEERVSIAGDPESQQPIAERGGGEAVADGELARRAQTWSGYLLNAGREPESGCLPLWPPAPDDTAGWGRVLERWPGLAPALPHVRGVADGVAAWVDRLKALGNGQAPLAAAAAWVMLGGPIYRPPAAPADTSLG